MKEDYTPGQGCLYHAHSEEECGCDGVDLTPKEVSELREKLSAVTGERDEAVNNYETAVLREHRMQEQRDRLAEALQDVMKYRKGEKPYDYWRLNENDRGNARFDGWNKIEDRINEALKAVKG